jgi:hypothetical protein
MPWTQAAIDARGQSEIDITALRDAFKASGKTAADVARGMGWTCKISPRGKPARRVADGPRALRAMGCKPYHDRNGPRTKRTCSYEMAVRLAEAIGVDPVDVGL